MIVQVFQHVAFEDIGSMREWLAARDAEIRYTCFFAGETPPPLDSFDFLIVMGGPMSVLDEDEFPWLAAEKVAVRTAMAAGKPVLGICLGAQLMASALGASIHKNPVKEIGWLPITAVEHGAPAFHFPSSANVFHWHGETFDIPANAVRLAQSDSCRNQAFQFGSKAIGLQFHLESTPHSVQSLLENCANELTAGIPTIQSSQEIQSATSAHYQEISELLYKILDYLLYTRV